jgi:hypothetical protein
MRFKLFFAISSLLLVGATCKKQDRNEQHLIEFSFEEDEPFRLWHSRQRCCDYSLTQSNERSTDGTHSLRIEVRSTDPQTRHSIRSELTQDRDKPGSEYWYGFNMFLENWDYDDAGEHVFQWHPDNPRGTATASLLTNSGRYIFETNTTGKNAGSRYNDLGPILNNEWVAWVIHVKWESEKTGILQVWKNGSLMINQSNIQTCPAEGVYFKLGINKFGWGITPSTTTKRVLYFDEVRIGNETTTYDDVKPK